MFGDGPSGESDPIAVAPGIEAISASSVPWFGTLRGRIGLGTDSTLFYLTAGLAVAQVDNEVSTTTFAGETVSNTHIGWVAGAGIEQKVDGTGVRVLRLGGPGLYLQHTPHGRDVGAPFHLPSDQGGRELPLLTPRTILTLDQLTGPASRRTRSFCRQLSMVSAPAPRARRSTGRTLVE